MLGGDILEHGFKVLWLELYGEGYAHGGGERTGLRYAARACTQGAAEKALRLLRWRLVCIEEAWRQPNAHGFTRDACTPSSLNPNATASPAYRRNHWHGCLHTHVSVWTFVRA